MRATVCFDVDTNSSADSLQAQMTAALDDWDIRVALDDWDIRVVGPVRVSIEAPDEPEGDGSVSERARWWNGAEGEGSHEP